MRLRHRTRPPARRSAPGRRVGAAPQTPPKITSIRQGGTKAGRHVTDVAQERVLDAPGRCLRG